jgi:hypothetical protein
MIIYKPIKIVWYITGIDGFGFGSDKVLYNLKTCRNKKQISNNGSIGYTIQGKFYSLPKLKLMLYKPGKQITPF